MKGSAQQAEHVQQLLTSSSNSHSSYLILECKDFSSNINWLYLYYGYYSVDFNRHHLLIVWTALEPKGGQSNAIRAPKFI